MINKKGQDAGTVAETGKITLTVIFIILALIIIGLVAAAIFKIRLPI
jgi:hypothetical protein